MASTALREIVFLGITFLLFSLSEASTKYYTVQYVTLDESKGAQIHTADVTNFEDVPANWVAKAIFDNQINKTGWSFLELQSNGQATDEDQVYAAGVLEGYVTSELIYEHWFNTMKGFCDGREKTCRRIQKYLDKNNQWIKANIDSKEKKDPYWYQVKLFYIQLKGIKDGYNRGIKDASKHLKLNDLLWHNIQGDLEDLTTIFGPRVRSGGGRVTHEERWSRVLGSGSCSALVKVLPGATDLLVGHDTWSSYQNMLRVEKLYILPLRRLAGSPARVPGVAMSFSSYPGIVTSGDDFYIMSSGLVTLETTIGVNNDSLWKFVRPSQVLETVRSMVANRLAVGGRAWAALFRDYNSGTYNNQWMVVDYARWRAAGPEARARRLPSGLLWVLEQLPGLVVASDRTDALRARSYWPSYNAPSFQEVFNASGTQALVDKFGDWFSYERTPRALIFKRDQGRVRDLTSMLAMLEYNDFRRDPLSRCACQPPYSAENAIAARNDLNPANGTYPFGALGHRSHGAIDTKITSSVLASRMVMMARSGPVFNAHLPPFRWSTVDFGATTPHVGHPDLWTFPPVTYIWRWV
ncbi:hypothetical protein R5R35_004170 [Gryllus longicercus]|uniref:Phospholipase B-like n=1 Tax=Gryllus longicercus TaxID=2509291 RepID=A0AAN9Z5H6_9ORTH